MKPFDVAVIGAGFGGLAAALTLAERGVRVALIERLRYPGGCASTFSRGGYRYESGATLFSGFGEGMLFERWIREHGLDVRFEMLDPVIELRAEGLSLKTPPDRGRFIGSLAALPGAPAERLRAFFEVQRKVAAGLWPLFDSPELLPPFDLRALGEHARRLPAYLPLLRLMGRPLEAVLDRFGLARFRPLRLWLDALCQITVQAPVSEAEAPFALAAMDYPFRGTGHVRGGIGELAWALARRVEALGGTLLFSEEVRGLSPTRDGFQLRTRRGEVSAERVIANLTPHASSRLIGAPHAKLSALASEIELGWGAAMRYLVLDPEVLADRPEPFHLELIGDDRRPLTTGNHLFVSVSGAAECRLERSPEMTRGVLARNDPGEACMRRRVEA